MGSLFHDISNNNYAYQRLKIKLKLSLPHIKAQLKSLKLPNTPAPLYDYLSFVTSINIGELRIGIEDFIQQAGNLNQ
ncbi:4740_t:CDS:2 [Cetraspora pellucida]|uniref:4740_t:CDS:1 n=1 Tax=Cetraspora pellucida TaxID=1433469 RepID=A0A9N9DSZ2_9GLOM|nr:4740_t:CDS:2 [Cetraspora pellucida]